MLEPDVTITDYILAAQCLGLALLIYRKSANMPWLLLFGSLGAASLIGGTVHGFFPDESSLAYAILWRLTLLSIGGTAFAGWYVGSAFLKDKRMAAWIEKAAIAEFLLFSAIVIFYSQLFLLAALNYLLAVIFLIVVFLCGYFKTKEKAFLFGLASMAFTLLGSFVQIAKISLHPDYLNHNALYHAIQFIAIWLLFFAALWDIKDETEQQYHPA
jgi:hypothetical protein